MTKLCQRIFFSFLFFSDIDNINCLMNVKFACTLHVALSFLHLISSFSDPKQTADLLLIANQRLTPLVNLSLYDFYRVQMSDRLSEQASKQATHKSSSVLFRKSHFLLDFIPTDLTVETRIEPSGTCCMP